MKNIFLVFWRFKQCRSGRYDRNFNYEFNEIQRNVNIQRTLRSGFSNLNPNRNEPNKPELNLQVVYIQVRTKFSISNSNQTLDTMNTNNYITQAVTLSVQRCSDTNEWLTIHDWNYKLYLLVAICDEEGEQVIIYALTLSVSGLPDFGHTALQCATCTTAK